MDCELLHAYVYGVAPPETFALAVPIHWPLHDAGVDTAVKFIPETEVTAIVCVCVQPFASVMVTVYVPEPRLFAVEPVCALLHKYA